jgi:hypothetical protein
VRLARAKNGRSWITYLIYRGCPHSTVQVSRPHEVVAVDGARAARNGTGWSLGPVTEVARHAILGHDVRRDELEAVELACALKGRMRVRRVRVEVTDVTVLHAQPDAAATPPAHRRHQRVGTQLRKGGGGEDPSAVSVPVAPSTRARTPNAQLDCSPTGYVADRAASHRLARLCSRTRPSASNCTSMCSLTASALRPSPKPNSRENQSLRAGGGARAIAIEQAPRSDLCASAGGGCRRARTAAVR